MPAVPTSNHPDADLLALELELEYLLVRWEDLRAAWPKGRTAVERARIGREVDDTLDRISELQRGIVTTPAHTLAGAVVPLRRLAVHVDEKNAAMAARVTAIAAVVEREARERPAQAREGRNEHMSPTVSRTRTLEAPAATT